MGNVGNIEKVMVAGILAIILCILGIAVWGHQAGSDVPESVEETARAAEAGYPLRVDAPSAGSSPRAADERSGVVPVNDYLVIGSDDLRVAGGEPADISAPPAAPVNEEPAGPARPESYTVQSGDSFERIAVRLFGDRTYVDELMKANEDVDPRRMRVGQVLNVPQLAEEPPATNQAPTAVVPAPASQAARTDRTYTVKKGDTLFAIARDQLGSSGRWRDLWQANRGKLSEPSDLKVGMVLSLP